MGDNVNLIKNRRQSMAVKIYKFKTQLCCSLFFPTDRKKLFFMHLLRKAALCWAPEINSNACLINFSYYSLCILFSRILYILYVYDGPSLWEQDSFFCLLRFWNQFYKKWSKCQQLVHQFLPPSFCYPRFLIFTTNLSLFFAF